MADASDEPTGLRFPRFRWAIFCLVFFGIPLLLVWLGFHNIWRDLEAKEQRRLDERLERVVSGFDQFRRTDDFVDRIFRILVQRVFVNSRTPEKTFARYRAHLHRRFPGLFEFTYIDRNGEARSELCDRTLPSGRFEYKTTMRWFAAAVRAKTRNDDDGLLKQKWGLFQTYLGQLLQPGQFKLGTLRMASHKNERHFVVVSSWTPRGMLIAHVNYPPNWDALAAIDRVNYFNAHSKRLKAFVIDETGGTRARIVGDDADPAVLARVNAVFAAAPKAVITDGNVSWAHVLLSPAVKVFVRSPVTRLKEVTEKRVLLNGVLITLFLLLSFPTWMVMSGKWLPYISIRQKLVGLFLYMVGLPLAFMSLVAGDYLGEKRVVLEKQVHDEMEKSLLLFDRRMPMMIGELERLITRMLGPVIPAGAPLRGTMVDRMERFQAHTGLDAGFLVNEEADVEYINGSVGIVDERNRKLLKPIYKNLFRQYNPTDDQGNRSDDMENVRESPAFQIATAGGIDVESLYADIASSLGRMIQYNFTGRRSIQIMLPVMDATGRVRYLLSTGWQRSRIEKKYMMKYLLPTCRQLDDTRWGVFDREDKRIVIPTGFSRVPAIEAFAARVTSQGQTVRDSMELQGSRYLLTGVPGQELSSINLIAVTSDRFIRTELGRLQWMVGIVSLAILLTGATVGTLLARKFLEPIGNLAAGVASLRMREFEKRLPILDHDELGDLSQTFNEMMEGMADLEVARIVQESLFPTKAVEAGPFGIHGSCVSATQAGGDYYDFFPMPDGQVMLLVGDVSGHGVGAAMVMAMAKALVAHMVTQSVDPAVLLASLNATLLKVLNRKRMMSCFIAFLDGKRMQMVYANAGHNDPFVVRGGRAIQIEGERSFPLGSSKRNTFTSSAFAFEAGDQLVLYTDGLIEAEAVDGQAVGYARFIETLPTLMRESAAGTEQAIRDWHRLLVKPAPQADDITVVVARVG
ncbi:MAG TPA: SpoIIE family protein phosphatase [Candidatus Ozemobacteraceae bacterium]|nr:SpoIIE family protein phosphatase [Candidatus Ozemobacteraceae bacterium]